MKKFDTSFGEAQVNDIMIDIDGTNLEEGVSVKCEDADFYTEIVGLTTNSITIEQLENIINY